MKTSERITPSLVSGLEPGEVFVFGSNINGMHMGGAARVALERFGAVWGVGEGLQGRSGAVLLVILQSKYPRSSSRRLIFKTYISRSRSGLLFWHSVD